MTTATRSRKQSMPRIKEHGDDLTDVCRFAIGSNYVFLYPKFPYEHVRGPLEPHWIVVTDIIDHMINQYDPADIEADIFLHRSRWTVVGRTLDTDAPVSFSAKHIKFETEVLI